MVVGVQKGGTSLLQYLLRDVACFPPDTAREPHFWDDVCFAASRAGPHDAERYRSCYYGNSTRAFCRPQHNLLMFDKSPATYTKPWVPFRLMEAFASRPIIVILLRDPTARAWSGFLQCYPEIVPRTITGPAKPSARPQFSRSLFDNLTRLELDLISTCRVPAGSGDFAADFASAKAFSLCCESVALRHGHDTWPGCNAYSGRPHESVPTSAACTVTRSPHGLCRGRRNRWSGGAFGDYCFDHVRQGLYVRHLPAWYASGLDVRLILSEELYARPMSVVGSLLRWQPLSARHSLGLRERLYMRARAMFGYVAGYPVGVTNSRAKDALHAMPHATERELRQLYRPYNRELAQRYLHRDPGWN